MTGATSGDNLARPTTCPFCKGRVVDTLAKVITPTTCWRCRACDKTWTIVTRGPSSTGTR